MAVRNLARNQQEFIYLINQALDKIFGLRATIEYDEVFMGDTAMIVESRHHGQTLLLNAVKSGEYNTGEYNIGEGDYPEFQHVLKNTDHRAIPFWSELKLILNTHTKGYQEQNNG